MCTQHLKQPGRVIGEDGGARGACVHTGAVSFPVKHTGTCSSTCWISAHARNPSLHLPDDYLPACCCKRSILQAFRHPPLTPTQRRRGVCSFCLQELVNAGDLTEDQAEQLTGNVQALQDRGEKISSDMITSKVRRCGICRQPGHNRRTCPRRSDNGYSDDD